MAVEKDVLDELQVGVGAKDLVIDIASPSVRADHETRHSQAVSVGIDLRWYDVIVKPAPVIP